MDTEIARDSWSAWKHLCEQGRIEIDRRDRDLAVALREELAPEAASLEAAIRSVSTDRLVAAIFRRVAPFAQMFADIIDFFKAAGARTGREHWRIKLEHENLELKDFESFIEHWTSIKMLVNVPSADRKAVWRTYPWMREEFPGDVLAFLAGEGHPGNDPEVDRWLEAYANGQYLPFPESLNPSHVSPGLADIAGIIFVAAERLRETFGTRDRLMKTYSLWDGPEEKRERVLRFDPDDAFAIGSLAQEETDYWLGSMVTLLNWWQARPADQRAGLEQNLADLYRTYGRREFPLNVDFAELERILNLPVWRGRNELYAVWIATQIVAALPEHDIELHHENGRIVFAFKETVIATIRDTTPEIRLIGERRQKLDDPIGKGRVGGVQPDFGLWSNSTDGEQCILVIEVKHYLKAARRSFHNAVIDYANAHPKAEVALVNYGPVADMLDGVERELLKRCRQMGDLTPSNLKKLEAFKTYVKDNVDRTIEESKIIRARADAYALVIDVSSSMKPLLQDPWLETYIEARASDFELIVLADTQIRAQCSPDDVVTMARRFNGGITELLGVVNELIAGRRGVVVLTDNDGSQQLQRLAENYVVTLHPLGQQELTGVVILQSPHGTLTKDRSDSLQSHFDQGHFS